MLGIDQNDTRRILVNAAGNEAKYSEMLAKYIRGDLRALRRLGKWDRDPDWLDKADLEDLVEEISQFGIGDPK
ncbi:hypothetical protein ACYOEI_03345 [Singulisphaera rosea]